MFSALMFTYRKGAAFRSLPLIFVMRPVSDHHWDFIRLPLLGEGCMFVLMSWRPFRKLVGIGNVFLGTELLDIAEYDLEIYEENPEDHEHHGGNWTPGTKRVEGTVVGELPIRQDLKLITEEGYAVSFYLRDSFGTVVILDTVVDGNGNTLR